MNKKIIVLIVLVLIIFGVVGYKFYYKSNSGVTTNNTGKLGEILKRGEMIVGTDATYAPLESKDAQGNIVGMDVDIVKQIAADMGVKVTFKDIPWDNLFQSIQNGDVDMSISAITITAERAQTLGFSDPYFNAGQVMVALANTKHIINTPLDLKGLKISAQINTTGEVQAKKYASSPSLVSNFEEYAKAQSDLINGKFDVMIIDYPAALSMVAKDKRLAIKGDIFTQEFYGIATQKNQPDLLLKINNTIRRLKQDGTLKQFEDQWLVK